MMPADGKTVAGLPRTGYRHVPLCTNKSHRPLILRAEAWLWTLWLTAVWAGERLDRYVPSLCTRLPATRVQPSTSTKKISLNGSDTTTGGSIIMLIDIRTDATTRSMIRKGRNNESRSRRRASIPRS